MLFDLQDPDCIEYWQNHVGYYGIQHTNIDRTQSLWWGINGNVVRWNFDFSFIVEEIYIGDRYTMIVTTTTERVALWFANSTEVKVWDLEQAS